MQPPSSSSAPQRLGPFVIVSALAQGGMGVVYRARHEATGQVAAVKTVMAPGPEVLEGIRREIQALSRLRHPGVVRIVAEGLSDAVPWYAMELLEGTSLDAFGRDLWHSSRLSRVVSMADQMTLAGAVQAVVGSPASGPSLTPVQRANGADTGAWAPPAGAGEAPPPSGSRPRVAGGKLEQVLTLAHELCWPLSFLHGEGVVHRDLKPENVVLRQGDGRPVLIDFGVVSEFAASKSREVLDVGGLPLGTAGYMAPEQIRGEYVDARTDLYALGCILYELLCGRLPFMGSVVSIMHAHLGEPPPSLSTWVTGVPDALEELVRKLLAKDPRDRFGHADDVAQALRGLGAKPAHEPAHEPAKPYLYRPGFSGRETVVGKILGHLFRERRRGGCVLVRAESGMGKTRLAMEVARQARRQGLTVVTGECLPFVGGGAGEGAGPPLHPLRGLFLAIADQARSQGEDYTHAVLGDRGKLLAHYEASLASVPGLEAYAEPPALPSNAARERLLLALRDVLEAFAGGAPLLLVLDDLQWADELTMEFLLSLRPELFERCPVLVLGTCRSDEQTAQLRDWASAESVVTFDLGKLDEQSTASMVAEMMAQPVPPPSLVQFLLRHAAGNPFFVAEYLRAAVGEGLLGRDASGRWRLTERASGLDGRGGLPLPTSLRELSARRLSGLGDDARALASFAAVAGGEVPGEILAGGARERLGDERYLAALDELLARQVLDEASAGVFRFTHDSFRVSVYEATPLEQRPPMHRRVAELLERLLPDERRGLYDAVLAGHWLCAGDEVKAIGYLERAGEHALATGAYRETARHLEQALSLEAKRRAASGDSPEARLRRARWTRQLAEAYLRLGRKPEGLRHANDALALLGRGFPEAKSELAIGLAREIGRQARSRFFGRRPAPRVDPRVELEASRVCQELAVVYYHADDPARSVYAALRGANLSEAAGTPSPEMARAYAALTVVTGVLPPYTLGQSYVNLGRKAARAVGDPHAEAWVWTATGVYKLGLGKWAEAEHALSKAVSMYRKMGDVRLWEESSSVLAFALCGQGELRRSQAIWLEVGASAERRDDVQILTWSLCGRAETGLRLGQIEAVIDCLERAQGILSSNIERANEIRALGLLAQARWLDGRHDQALDAAERGAARIRQTMPSAVAALDGYAGVAETFLSACERATSSQPAGGGGRGARASHASHASHASYEAAARQAVKSLRQFAMSFPIGNPRALRCEARLAALSGDARRAASLFRKSAAAAASLEMPFDEAVALDRLALFVPSRAEASSLASQATAVFERLGTPRPDPMA